MAHDAARLPELIRERGEIMAGNRCPHCFAKWDDDVTPASCCPAMRAEFARISNALWTPSPIPPTECYGIRAWLEAPRVFVGIERVGNEHMPEFADEPVVVTGGGS